MTPPVRPADRAAAASRSAWASRARGCPGSCAATGAARRRARTGSPPPSAPADLDDPAGCCGTAAAATPATALLVPWDGPALRSATRYHWRVEVWDETGAPAGVGADAGSRPACCTATDWTAVWIGRDPIAPAAGRIRRRTTTGRRSRSRAAAAVPAARVRPDRGGRCGPGCTPPRAASTSPGSTASGSATCELAPGWTEYHHRLQYQTYDVTDHAARGRQRARAPIVADGWWCGLRRLRPAPPGAALRRPRRRSWPSWCSTSPTAPGRWSPPTPAGPSGPARSARADLLMGEYVDARRARARLGRARVAVDGLPAGRGARHRARPAGRRARPPGPGHPRRRRRSPCTGREPGRFIVDFGQNLVGRVRLTVRGAAAGRRIVLRHAEILDATASCTSTTCAAPQATDVYVTARRRRPRCSSRGSPSTASGTSRSTATPASSRRPTSSARVLHNDTPWTGRFECSDPMVNQLQSNIAWGQRGNFVAVPTDCPQRDERLGWLADAQIFAPTASRNADVSAFFARWLRDVVDGQDADGAFRDVAPVVALDREAAPAWGDAGVIIPWHLWRTYGDRRVLRALLRRDGRLGRGTSAGTTPTCGGGTAPATPTATGCRSTPSTPRDVLATAYFARSAQIVADAAEVLGRDAEAAEHRALHAAIRAAFIEAYVGRRRHRRGRHPDRLPAGAGVRAAAGRAGAGGGRAPGRRHREARTTGSPPGSSASALLCPVLAEHGRADLAYALLHQDEYPSWGYSIRHGATTIWERWDGWTDHGGFQSAAMNSFNHYSLGSVGDWLFGRVAGIDQTAAVGRRTASCCCGPLPGGRLTWARAEQETVRGTGRLRLVARRRPDHRDRHGAARQHRRTGDPHARPGQRPRGRRAACRPAGRSRGRAVRRRGHPAAGVRPLHRQRRGTSAHPILTDTPWERRHEDTQQSAGPRRGR